MVQIASGDGGCGLRAITASVFFRWELGDQVRPIASNNGTYFVVDGADTVETLLDLPAEEFKFLPAEQTAVQEFHSHVGLIR